VRLGRWLGRVAWQLLLWLVLAALLAPVAIVAVMSLSADEDLRFPPATWGTRQYDAALSGEWMTPLWRSVEVGLIVTAVATVLGLLFVLGRRRLRGRRLWLLEGLVIGPIVVPVVAYAVALFGVFADLRLIGSLTGIVAAHAALALPFVIFIVGAALTRIPPEYETAALSLGASRARATVDGAVRLVLPAVASAAVLAFVTSFDEAVLVSFLSGPGFSTLPLEVLRSLRTGVDPAVTAVSTLLMAASAVLILVVAVLRRRQAAAPAAPDPER
jgi:ABC-type spermidine/putrescine transport system permease subunit II